MLRVREGEAVEREAPWNLNIEDSNEHRSI